MLGQFLQLIDNRTDENFFITTALTAFLVTVVIVCPVSLDTIPVFCSKRLLDLVCHLQKFISNFVYRPTLCMIFADKAINDHAECNHLEDLNNTRALKLLLKI